MAQGLLMRSTEKSSFAIETALLVRNLVRA